MDPIKLIEATNIKKKLAEVRSGDYVRVHHLIKEGSKQRVQIFEGTIIRARNLGSISAAITVRRIASGVGVEKIFMLHSPNVTKITVVRRSKVRRNFLSYYRKLMGKAMRLQDVDFDKEAANTQENKEEATVDETKAHKTDENKNSDMAEEIQPEAIEKVEHDEIKNSDDKDKSALDEGVENDENEAAVKEAEAGVQKE